MFAWWFNGIERQRERMIYAKLHKIMYDKGYTYQISFYGTLEKPYDDKHIQARIEVLCRCQFTEDQIRLMYTFFMYEQPNREYSLYILKDENLVEVYLPL